MIRTTTGRRALRFLGYFERPRVFLFTAARVPSLAAAAITSTPRFSLRPSARWPPLDPQGCLQVWCRFFITQGWRCWFSLLQGALSYLTAPPPFAGLPLLLGGRLCVSGAVGVETEPPSDLLLRPGLAAVFSFFLLGYTIVQGLVF